MTPMFYRTGSARSRAVSPRMVPLAAAALLAGAAGAVVQAQGGAPTGTGSVPPQDSTADLLLASDGAPAKPGRIPADTPEADAQLWGALAGALDHRTAREGPPAFELALSVRHKDETGSRDFDARFAYLDADEGFVRMRLLDDEGRTMSVQMRGPDPKRPGRLAYWYRKDRGEGVTDGWVLLSGVEAEDDREEVDRWASASYDIARVIQPQSMRIVGIRRLLRAENYDPTTGFLKLGGDPGVQLPEVTVLGKRSGRGERVRDLAARLEWIELATPDFRLFETGLDRRARRALRSTVKRVVFGLDPKTKLPNLILVSARANGPLQGPGSVLLQCTEWFDLEEDGKLDLPGRFYAYETVRSESSPSGIGFDSRSTADLYLLEGCTLEAKLDPGDFTGS